MRKTVILLLAMACLLAWPLAALAEEDPTPSQEDLNFYESEMNNWPGEVNAMIGQRAQPASGELIVKEASFKAKKSSDLSRAVELVKRSINAQIEAWAQQQSAAGLIPVEEPAPQSKVDAKWGIHHFKFYVRATVYLKVWFQKLPGS